MRVRPLIFAENGCFFLIFPVVFCLFFRSAKFFFLLHNAVVQPFCAAVVRKCEKKFLQFEKKVVSLHPLSRKQQQFPREAKGH